MVITQNEKEFSDFLIALLGGQFNGERCLSSYPEFEPTKAAWDHQKKIIDELKHENKTQSNSITALREEALKLQGKIKVHNYYCERSCAESGCELAPVCDACPKNWIIKD